MISALDALTVQSEYFDDLMGQIWITPWVSGLSESEMVIRLQPCCEAVALAFLSTHTLGDCDKYPLHI